MNQNAGLIQVSVRFYAELNDFLSGRHKQSPFQVSIPDHTTVKHLVESIGVPHTEIDMILVNSTSVSFSFIPKHGDYISVYPVFESFDISSLLHLRPEPLRHPRFILDTHLGKLAAYLRMLGFDTLYQNDYEDQEIAVTSKNENRIVLTRDTGLLKRCEITRGYYVRNTIPSEQVVEVIQRFNLSSLVHPFLRCMVCNHLLENVEKGEIIQRLQPKTIERFDAFQICPGCQRVYWKGKHYERMKNFIKEITQ